MVQAPVQSPERFKGCLPLPANSNLANFHFRLNQHKPTHLAALVLGCLRQCRWSGSERYSTVFAMEPERRTTPNDGRANASARFRETFGQFVIHVGSRLHLDSPGSLIDCSSTRLLRAKRDGRSFTTVHWRARKGGGVS